MHLRSMKIGFCTELWERASDRHVIELLLELRLGDLVLLSDPLVTFDDDNIRIVSVRLSPGHE